MNVSETHPTRDGLPAAHLDRDGAPNVAPPASARPPLLSFAVPCYNAAAYLDTCVSSILAGSKDFYDEIEIILVDDGSDADDTAKKLDAWAQRYPDMIRAIHQQNGGHGEAVNTGLAHAQGLWFKVVDADDWLDAEALNILLTKLRQARAAEQEIDMFIVNYVYEKRDEGKRKAIRYRRVLPQGRIFGWSEVGRFAPSQNLLMHAVIYRTQLLKDIGLRLPSKTFYVDNIFVYVPLPSVQTMLYLDIDLYRYYIGRQGQSVGEQTMIGRIEQQLRVTRIMIDAFHLTEEVQEPRLRAYMAHYLTMMMTICSVLLRLSNRADAEVLRREIWVYLKEHDPKLYPRIRGSLLGISVNLPGDAGRSLACGGYRIAQKFFSFN
ncbi:MAG: glycosyltransferase [Coriobacteriales bacterium]|jgi:glycosyltransferase involved in cell wall biosynthesis|nr:glycosyltransferase [Coriobacteriales bacterium]